MSGVEPLTFWLRIKHPIKWATIQSKFLLLYIPSKSRYNHSFRSVFTVRNKRSIIEYFGLLWSIFEYLWHQSWHKNLQKKWHLLKTPENSCLGFKIIITTVRWFPPNLKWKGHGVLCSYTVPLKQQNCLWITKIFALAPRLFFSPHLSKSTIWWIDE